MAEVVVEESLVYRERRMNEGRGRVVMKDDDERWW
jgi:hypothetical protein